MVSMWFTFRRIGMSTDYARLRYVTHSGEFRTLLEAGAIPDNKYLPPHLRLDKTSYLDYAETRIADAPVYDMSLSDKDLAMNVSALLPEGERHEYTMQNSWISSKTVILPATRENRLVKRRLGLSPSERDAQD